MGSCFLGYLLFVKNSPIIVHFGTKENNPILEEKGLEIDASFLFSQVESLCSEVNWQCLIEGLQTIKSNYSTESLKAHGY